MYMYCFIPEHKQNEVDIPINKNYLTSRLCIVVTLYTGAQIFHSFLLFFSVNSTTSSSDSPIHPTPSLVSLSLHCNEDNGFFLYITDDEENEALNNTCQARCSKWHNYESQTHFYVRDGVLILFTVIGVIGAVCVIFFSIIRHERM